MCLKKVDTDWFITLKKKTDKGQSKCTITSKNANMSFMFISDYIYVTE